mgnify:CR=1 FL=1
MRNLDKILNERKDINGYLITEKTEESFQLFFVKDRLETIRKTNVLDQKVMVYVSHDDFLGSFEFSVLASDTKASLAKKLDQAVYTAKLINNKKFDLVKGEKSNHNLKSNISKYDFKELGYEIYNVSREAIKETGGDINALEIFINKNTEKVINSSGVNRKMQSYNIFVEAIPTWNGENESVELYEAISVSEFNKEALKEELVESLNNVRARYEAKKLDNLGKYDIVLTPSENSMLFSDISRILSYAALYQHFNFYNLGDMVSESKKDKINIKAKGSIKGSTNSRAFDQDGFLLTEKELVKDNKVVGFYGANKFAQYVGMDATGNLPCIEVKKGSLTDNELAKIKHIECVSFSGLQVDLISDYIGGEVRLGYLVENGERKPVTGFTISAKLSDVLNNIRLSNKDTVYRNYKGPKKVLLRNMNVL